MKKIILFGGGSFSKVLINEIKKQKNCKFEGIFDNKVKKKNYLGNDEFFFKNKKFHAMYGIVAVADPKIKKKIIDRISKKIKKFKWHKIISSNCIKCKTSIVGEGSILMPGSVINSSAKIGKHCLINTGCIIEHDNKINNFVSFGPGSVTCGGVYIDSNSFIGAKSIVKENIKIQKNCIIGANSFVNKNCKKNSLYFGSPIKFKKKLT